MKRVVVIAALILAGCSHPDKIQANRPDHATATLEMCGTSTPLPASGPSRFTGRRAITCKGRGLLHVTFVDGSEVTCPIGSGAGPGQDWSFVATKAGCRASADAPRAMTLRIAPAPKP